MISAATPKWLYARAFVLAVVGPALWLSMLWYDETARSNELEAGVGDAFAILALGSVLAALVLCAVAVCAQIVLAQGEKE